MPFVSTAARMLLGLSPFESGLVLPGILRDPLTISRSQVGGVQSSAVNASADGLAFFGADAPRFNGLAQRLLIEGQGTNGFHNPRLEGALAGNPGTPPSNTNTAFFQGLSREIVGSGMENNISYVDIRFFGTATGGSFSRYANINFTTAALNISGNATNTFSFFVRMVAGSMSQISSCRFGLQGRDSGGSIVSGQSVSANFTPTGAALGTQNQTITWTPSDAAVVYGEWFVDILRGSSATVDLTLRIGAPQHELGAFATSRILPPIGTPGASTRGTDVVTAPLSNLGIPANGACTILWSGVIPAFVTGNVHTVACLDDNSVNNRFTMRVAQASGQLQVMRALAGVIATANAGAVTAGTAFKACLILDGAGRAAVSLNGSAVAAVTGGPTSGLTQLRLGNISDASTPLFGETALLRHFPYAVTDAEGQALAGA